MKKRDVAKIARAANVATVGAQPAAPRLSVSSSRNQLIGWLRWNDPNGIWTDADMILEDMDPMTKDDAWIQIAMMLADDFPAVATILRAPR